MSEALDLKPFRMRLSATVGALVAIVAGGVILWFGFDIILLIVTGLVFGIFLRAIAEILHAKLHLSFAASLAVTLVALVVLSAALVWFIVPQTLSQLAGVRDALPGAWARFTDLIGIGGGQQAAAHSEAAKWGTSILTAVIGILSMSIDALLKLLLALMLGVYVAAEPNTYVQGVLHLVPLGRRTRMLEVIQAIYRTTKWWILGMSASMTIIGVSTAVGMLLIGMPFALGLGLIAGILSLIPNIGPTLAAVPGILIGLTLGVDKAVEALIVYLVTQGIETYLLTPLINRKAVHVPPAVTTASLLFMALFGGGLGILMAGPLTAAALVAVKMLYCEDVLGDHTV